MHFHSIKSKVIFNSLKIGISFLPLAIFVSMFEFILPLFLEDISKEVAIVGFIIGIGWLIVTFIDLIFGNLSDNIGKKKSVFIGIFIYLIFIFLMGFTTNIWFVTLLLIISYVGYDFFYISVQGLLVESSQKKYFNYAATGFYPLWDLGFIFGPFLGFLIVTYFGINFVFYVSIFLLITTLFISNLILSKKVIKQERKYSLKEFFSYLIKISKKDFLILVGSLSCTFWYILMVLSIPLFFAIEEENLFLAAVTMTIFMLPIFLTDLIVLFVANNKNIRKKLITISYFLSGLSLVAFFILEDFIIGLILIGINTLGFQAIWAITDIEAGLLSEKGKESMIQGIFFFTKNIGFFLGPLIFGLVVTYFNLKYPFLIMGIISIALGVIFLIKKNINIE